MPKIRGKILQYMNNRLIRLGTNAKEGRNTGELANLRRGIGKTPGEMPELWGVLFLEMPEELLSRSGSPSYAEWGIYTALTLYALHQQGNTESVHAEGVSLGRAIGKLVESEDDRPRVARRFNAFATSTDMVEAAQHLRGLIQLLKSKKISLDYVMLAYDLFEFQLSEETRIHVRLKWGQDFYRNTFTSEEMEEQK